jgi:hypothetical protein
VTEEQSPEPEPSLEPGGDPSEVPAADASAVPAAAPHTPRASQGETPLYKGEPLDAERGPGLGCFWIQVALLGFLLILTPLTVLWAWPAEMSAILLIVTLLLLLFAGQTVIFLLRLVAADRRSRRVPRSASARRTVGMLEDEASATGADPEAATGADPEAGDQPVEEPRPQEPAGRERSVPASTDHDAP